MVAQLTVQSQILTVVATGAIRRNQYYQKERMYQTRYIPSFGSMLDTSNIEPNYNKLLSALQQQFLCVLGNDELLVSRNNADCDL